MRIRKSNRGLTFSFAENEHFKVGSHYRYFVDVAKSEVIIVADENGKYKLNDPRSDYNGREVTQVGISRKLESDITCILAGDSENKILASGCLNVAFDSDFIVKIVEDI